MPGDPAQRLLCLAEDPAEPQGTGGCPADCADPTGMEGQGKVYGYRKLHDDLLDQGETCCPNRVARLTSLAGIKAQIGKRRPGSSGGRPSAIAANTLDRQFDVAQADHAWVMVITPAYARTRSISGRWKALPIWRLCSTFTRAVYWDGRCKAVRHRCCFGAAHGGLAAKTEEPRAPSIRTKARSSSAWIGQPSSGFTIWNTQ